MAALYGDECLWPSLAQRLREFGHDTQTARDSGLHNVGRPDTEVLRDATAAGRAVLTFSRTGFVALHRRGLRHAGMLVFKEDRDIEALAARIGSAIRDHEPLAGKLLRVRRRPAGSIVEESPHSRRT